MPSGNGKSILNGIENGELFGFIIGDVTTPQHLIDEIEYINFPPVIQRMDITINHLSEYMSERVQENATALPRTTVVQTYHAKQLLMFTPLVKFYIDLGLKISNITTFVQYLPMKCLKPFMEKVTNMRIAAAYDGEETKGNSAKLIGNSGYVS